jgi:hypothetical protein
MDSWEGWLDAIKNKTTIDSLLDPEASKILKKTNAGTRCLFEYCLIGVRNYRRICH